MKIYGEHILIGESFQSGVLEFDEKIESFLPGKKQDLGEAAQGAGDFSDSYVIPGLIDIHTHAAMGADASDGDPEGLQTMSRFYAEHGVTSWCPTTMTLKEPELTKACNTVRDFRRPEGGAKQAGIHLEGPFVCEAKRGAQNPENIHVPDAEMLKRLIDAAGGNVSLITMAPETEGGIAFIGEASKLVTVSIGHTEADYDTAMRAFAAGATHVTHLYNAMPGLHHRMPGVIGAAFDAGATAELICDGLHVHPSAVRIAEQLFGRRLVLISDSLRCTGMPDGIYPFGGQLISLKNGKATLKDTDTLAGSVISLMEGVRRAVSFGVPLTDAVLSATLAPAKAIHRDGEIGSLAAGKCADIVALSKDLEIQAVWIDGKQR